MPMRRMRSFSLRRLAERIAVGRRCDADAARRQSLAAREQSDRRQADQGYAEQPGVTHYCVVAHCLRPPCRRLTAPHTNTPNMKQLRSNS